MVRNASSSSSASAGGANLLRVRQVKAQSMYPRGELSAAEENYHGKGIDFPLLASFHLLIGLNVDPHMITHRPVPFLSAH